MSKYIKKTSAKETMVNNKIKILRDFCIVNEKNKQQVEMYLVSALSQNPHRNPQTVLDRAARSLILGKITI